ncbi:MAG: YggT family protein [Pseudomonadota bacterium]
MNAVIYILYQVMNFYWWIVILSAVFSWLYAFNIINNSNQFVNMIGNFLYQMTEPVYRPIRRFLPNLGGIDLSPIIVLFIIMFLQYLLINDIAPMLR